MRGEECRRRFPRSPPRAGCTCRTRGARRASRARRRRRGSRACLAFSSATALGGLPQLEVGIAPQRAEPVHGASTSTRSILPRSRFTFASFSPAMRCGKTFESPERLRRGAEVREPLVGDVEGVEAARRIHRRAHLQRLAAGASAKSTTISPRRASTSMPRSWLPSSCTSTAPSRNIGCWLSAGFSLQRARRAASSAWGAPAILSCSRRSSTRLARRLQRVHAQVERRRLLQASREREDLLVAHALAQALDDPVGKVGAHARTAGRRGPAAFSAVSHAFSPALSADSIWLEAHALHLHERGERDLARRGPRA